MSDWANLLENADRSVIAQLGGTVTYSPEEGDPVEVSAVFEQSYVRVDAGEAGLSSSGPAVFLRLADLPSDPAVGATVTVGDQDYRVREVREDGQGGVTLLMYETA